MRLARIIGSIEAATLIVTINPKNGAHSYPFKGPSPAPNDIGPVIDSTKESKRAKRRRLASDEPSHRAANKG
ncbi:hypothetical protein [Agrobacterium larrymoorei]|uniref:hypothetical protein n=1 Tax=Agrobacterium larrymoorei TaxID=160699 RepID=UPI0030BE9AC0